VPCETKTEIMTAALKTKTISRKDD